jgi:hypothetical protein
MSNNNDDHVMEETKVSSIGEFKQRKSDHLAKEKGLTVKTEVTCEGPVGGDIQNILKSELEKLGCAVNGFSNPDWIISIIAFSYYETVEMSIILRKLFRSTSPGSELEGWDDQGNAKLKDGAWIYESLRFHGLYGVRKMELADFLRGLIREFNSKHWNLLHDHKTAAYHSTAKPE